MKKEIIICAIIVITILVGNQLTQNYVKESVSELLKPLIEVREEILNEPTKESLKELEKKTSKIYEIWESKHNTLAYFIEHDELEKIETQLTAVKSDIETKEKEEAIMEIDKGAFLLKHMEDKYAFNLQNVF